MKLINRAVPLAFCAAAVLAAPQAHADRIANPLAEFNGLDKITGITTHFEVAVGAEYKFGSLTVKPFVCYSRPVTEEPKTTSFVQIDETEVSGESKRIFSGWMFAESPGLDALEHPTFDVWLTGCRDPNAPPPPVEEAPKPEDGQQTDEPATDD
ncbi:MAG: DUF2155 domain-containing protein [Hyphomicrobiales bacterium]